MQFLSKFQWYFLQKKKINLKICIESQKTLNTQGNLKENKGGGIMPLISNYTSKSQYWDKNGHVK